MSITIEQLENLTKTQSAMLHHYWSKTKKSDFKDFTKIASINNTPLPLLDIGEMIEFFQLTGYRINMDNAIPCSVKIPKLDMECCEWEISDTLWQGVKVILNQLATENTSHVSKI